MLIFEVHSRQVIIILICTTDVASPPSFIVEKMAIQIIGIPPLTFLILSVIVYGVNKQLVN